MAVLVIMESKGDPAKLLAASKELAHRSGPAQGLLARFVARNDDGIVLVHLWESEMARSAWQNNPAHRDALRASGMQSRVEERVVQEYAAEHIEIFASRPEPG
jgi:heme-degrading monooxygenase HmoA